MKLHLQLIPILLLVRSVASISDSVSVAASIQQAKNKIFGDGSPTFKGFMREMDTLRPGYATNCANDFGEVIIAPKDTKTIRALAVPRRLSYLCGHSVRISSTQFVDSNYPDQLQSTWAIVWDVCEECSLFGNCPSSSSASPPLSLTSYHIFSTTNKLFIFQPPMSEVLEWYWLI